MGLNDQVKDAAMNSSGKKFVFKEGVRFRHMTGKDPAVFRILPAFDPANPDPRTSSVPFRTPDGNLTEWAYILHICRFIGHGSGKGGGRQDLISLKSFAEPGTETYCPLIHLYKVIDQNSGDWGYLLNDTGERERAAFGRPLPHLIVKDRKSVV